MKLTCQSCETTGIVAEIDIAGTAVRFVCGACGATNEVGLPGEPAGASSESDVSNADGSSGDQSGAERHRADESAADQTDARVDGVEGRGGEVEPGDLVDSVQETEGDAPSKSAATTPASGVAVSRAAPSPASASAADAAVRTPEPGEPGGPDIDQTDRTDAERDEAEAGSGRRRVVPPVKCPKCGHRQWDERACHKCGLDFSLAREGHRPWEEYPPEKRPDARTARALWEAVLAAPRDESAHEKFVEHCVKTRLIDLAARRYRLYLADHPEDDIATAYFERVVNTAQSLVGVANLEGEAAGFRAAARRVRVGLWIAVAAICVFILVMIIRMTVSASNWQP